MAGFFCVIFGGVISKKEKENDVIVDNEDESGGA